MSREVIHIIGSCDECPFVIEGKPYRCQSVLNEDGDYKKCIDFCDVPDWCPLPAMPKREPISVNGIKQKADALEWNDTYTTGYVYGWNECLDEIERGSWHDIFGESEGGGDNG